MQLVAQLTKQAAFIKKGLGAKTLSLQWEFAQLLLDSRGCCRGQRRGVAPKKQCSSAAYPEHRQSKVSHGHNIEHGHTLD